MMVDQFESGLEKVADCVDRFVGVAGLIVGRFVSEVKGIEPQSSYGRLSP